MPKDFKDHTKGLFMECMAGEQKYVGEIITANENEVVLLLLGSRNHKVIPKTAVTDFEVIVSLTSNDPQKMGNKAGLSMLPVVVHGWWMIITVPINAAIATSTAKGAATGTYRMAFPHRISWEGLPKFARFPQGLPEGLSLEQVR